MTLEQLIANITEIKQAVPSPYHAGPKLMAALTKACTQSRSLVGGENGRYIERFTFVGISPDIESCEFILIDYKSKTPHELDWALLKQNPDKSYSHIEVE